MKNIVFFPILGLVENQVLKANQVLNIQVCPPPHRMPHRFPTRNENYPSYALIVKTCIIVIISLYTKAIFARRRRELQLSANFVINIQITIFTAIIIAPQAYFDQLPR